MPVNLIEEAKMIYSRVAREYAFKIREIFASEDTLKAYFTKVFSSLEFTRTDHWRGLLGKLLTDVWFDYGPEVRTVPTQYDQEQILIQLYDHMDYNLFTQVMLNLQKYVGFAYNIAKAKEQVEALEAFYKGKDKSPFAPKATMVKYATKFDELRYNNDLSALKALRIIEKFSIANSYRVTPMGSTPAFADSLNISMMGAGGDKYLVTIPNVRVHFYSWAQTPYILEIQPDGTFRTPGISYNFTSKSGGDTLNEVLFSRWVAHQVFGVIKENTVKVIIPRMNSVMVVTDNEEPLQPLTKVIQMTYPQVVYTKDERPQN